MRDIFVGLSISGAFFLGCAVATVASDTLVPPAHSAGAQGWDYECVRPKSSGWGGSEDEVVSRFADRLDEYGREGWEFIVLLESNHGVCFKRPL